MRIAARYSVPLGSERFRGKIEEMPGRKLAMQSGYDPARRKRGAVRLNENEMRFLPAPFGTCCRVWLDILNKTIDTSRIKLSADQTQIPS